MTPEHTRDPPSPVGGGSARRGSVEPGWGDQNSPPPAALRAATSPLQGEVGRPAWLDALAVYLKPRVLIILFLGFSAGLPLALSGSTLAIWMRESGVNLETIGLFALVGTPYAVKFAWAPLVDALDLPLLARLLGRRRAWLVLSQLLLIAAIVFLAFCDPAAGPYYSGRVAFD